MKSTGLDPLLQAWEKTLRTNQDRAAILEPRGKSLRTFGEIEEESHLFESSLLKTVSPGSVIAIQIGNHPTWPSLLLAALRSRLITLPLDQTITERERDVALTVCQVAALIESANASDLSSRPESVTLRSLPPEPVHWESNPPVLLKLTSGTTAAPRAIRFQSDQLLTDCTQICETMGIDSNDLNFAVVPLSHSYGFSSLITPLIAHGIAMVLSGDRMPRAVLQDLAQSGTTVFPGMPLFYQAFSDLNDLPRLPRLRLCISAGAPLPLETARKFRSKAQLSIHSFYGSSECGGICYDREALLLEEGFVGQPLEGVALEQLDPDASATRVQVRTTAAGDGYFPEPDSERLGRGRFIPDDLLATAEGGFRVVGRISDLINVAGRKVNPAEIEVELLRFAGVRAAVVFGRQSKQRNEEVAACVVIEPNILETDLLDYCRCRLSGWQVPKQIFFVDQIPTNERGKVNRRELAERFRF
jgi:long-chain acyl-CoA synthetase